MSQGEKVRTISGEKKIRTREKPKKAGIIHSKEKEKSDSSGKRKPRVHPIKTHLSWLFKKS